MGRAAWHGFVCFYRSNDLTFASSVAFYALLSLFPFLLLSLSVLGRVSADDHDRAAILGFVLQYFPRQFDFVTVQLDAFRQSKTALSLGSSVVMVWAALGFFGAITSAINYAFQVKPFGYWQHKLVSFLMLAAASLLMLAGLILLSARTVLLSRWFPSAPLHLPMFAWLGSFLVEWLSSLIFIVVVGLLFYFVPNARVRFRDVWPGAIVTGALWRLALKGFGWYVQRPVAVQRPRLRRRGGRLPDVGLRVRRDPDLRRRVHGGLRAPAPRHPRREDAGRCHRARQPRSTPRRRPRPRAPPAGDS